MKNLNKKLCALMAALMLCCTALASCGDSDSSAAAKSDKSTSAAQTEENVSYDVAAIADRLKNEITYKDGLNELDAAMYEKIYKIKPELYTASKVYVGAGGATAEELACFEAKDEAAAGEIKTCLETRIENQKKSFENYNPEELDKLGSPVLVQKGKYVFMCLSDDNSKANEIIG